MKDIIELTKTDGDWIDSNGKIHTGNFWKITFGATTICKPGYKTKKQMIEHIQDNWGIDAVINYRNRLTNTRQIPTE